MLDFSNSATIYVSATEGSDAYSGFAPHPGVGNAGPLRTLRRAVELVTSLHIPDSAQPVAIRVSGDHYLSAPLEIGGKDRFADADYIPTDLLIESYGDAPARLIGGRRLEGFAPDSFNGTPCLSLHIPEVESGAWRFTDLYVNGRRADAARYPREGTLRAVDTENSAATRLGDGSRWFIAHSEDLAGIDGIEDAIVSFYHYWIDEHSPVESYDPATGKLVMQYRSRFRMTVNYDKNDTSEFCYYLENIAAGFGAPNSWYLDVPRGMLYYVPADPAATIESLEVFAPMTDRLLHSLKLLLFLCYIAVFACAGWSSCAVRGTTPAKPATPAQSMTRAANILPLMRNRRLAAMVPCSLNMPRIAALKIAASIRLSR